MGGDLLMQNNESQERISVRLSTTRLMVTKFEDSIRAHDRQQRPASIHPLLWSKMREAMSSQLVDLKHELLSLERQAGTAS